MRVARFYPGLNPSDRSFSHLENWTVTVPLYAFFLLTDFFLFGKIRAEKKEERSSPEKALVLNGFGPFSEGDVAARR
jgi:hypothetical protein